MRLTDISLNWLLPVGVMLVGVLVAVAVVARGKRTADKAAPDDSWERSEERRRRKEAVYGTASYVLLFCCAAVAAALSFHGLVGFGQQNLNLSGRLGVPRSLRARRRGHVLLGARGARGQPR